MNLYLVDFENVNENGLTGADTLSRDNHVIVFYGPLNKSISFELHTLLQKSPARFEYIKTNKVGKNYLDFYMTASLSFVLAKKHYEQVYIISNDHGFAPVVDFWMQKGVMISQRPTVSL